ncbi:hypothetical protein Y032_0022g504 [Ancylostoma ceylanicum]|uniref:Uncharacterized protein n=1 Tax=Ancylostoma ceylanicum TaxID=53326 RepID=A0A016UYV5_9BILA|nr:hypothetical protein Y032_0022g504 [Ancylostoma ceylanicum]
MIENNDAEATEFLPRYGLLPIQGAVYVRKAATHTAKMPTILETISIAVVTIIMCQKWRFAKPSERLSKRVHSVG